MQLNLPILDLIADCKSLLIAGMGGGYDVFCGLPIYFELRERGFNVHLANFSFSDVLTIRHGVRLSETLVGATAERDVRLPYFPEYYLSRWFKETRGEDVTLWAFQKTGAQVLIDDYQRLCNHLNIDGILLIDGGVDSLMRGDEYEIGTLIEDTISLIAANELAGVKTKLLACAGFGAETGITHAHVLENIAALTQKGAFFGACALTKHMEVYQAYEAAVLYVQGQPWQDSSVINSSIISAVRGEYGNFHLTERTAGSRLWISPFMPLYWFFDLRSVARRSHIYDLLHDTYTFQDGWRAVVGHRMNISVRPDEKIPLR